MPTLLNLWFEMKADVRESIGLGFSGSWMTLYQNYSSTFASDRDAVGSKLTLNFNWEILNRGKPNALVFEFLVEDRRAFAKIIAAPFEREKTVDARRPTIAFQRSIDCIIATNVAPLELRCGSTDAPVPA